MTLTTSSHRHVMRLLVAIKRVVDTQRVRIKADKSGVEVGSKGIINPFCEVALEEGIRLKEQGFASDVAAVTLGPKQAQVKDQLRIALALGADRAIHIQTDAQLQPLAVAKVLAAVAKQEHADLILLGKQAVDADNSQTGQMLAGLTGWPQAVSASKIEVEKKSGRVHVTREVDGGTDIISLKLPAVVTADLQLNQPRYASLPNIMKANRQIIHQIALEDLAADVAPRCFTLHVDSPPPRKPGMILNDVAELVDRLRHEAKVI